MYHIQIGAQAARDVQAYIDYYNIVGNDDNGVCMSEKEFQAYKKKVSYARKNHLYVSWRNTKSHECKMIGPSSLCFCGHRYKEHNFDDIYSKKIFCKNQVCPCQLFCYIPVHGSSDLKCCCKHSYTDHHPLTKKCFVNIN